MICPTLLVAANSAACQRLNSAIACVALMVFGIAGCGGGHNAVNVHGKISFNDKEVTSGVINFQAKGARPEGGGITADGTYSFDLPPGEYQVRIDSPPPLPEGWKEGEPLPKLAARQVPEKFANYGTSGLTAKVTGDEDPQTIDFKLP